MTCFSFKFYFRWNRGRAGLGPRKPPTSLLPVPSIEFSFRPNPAAHDARMRFECRSGRAVAAGLQQHREASSKYFRHEKMWHELTPEIPSLAAPHFLFTSGVSNALSLIVNAWKSIRKISISLFDRLY